jgi:CRP/FNR family transcriptional regulator
MSMTLSQLVRFRLLSTLSAKQLRRIRALSSTRDFSAGEHIFGKSETAKHIFFVGSGQIKIYCRSAARKSKTFAYLGPGDIFGEMGVLLGAPRSASAQAVVKSRLLILRNRDFQKFLLSDAGVTLKLLKTVAERLRRADEEIEGLLFGNMLCRVSKAVLNLSSSGQTPRRKGLLIKQRYSQQELADLVGTTREPLSRALAALRRADLIDVQGGHIRIVDADRLQSLIRTCAGRP